MSVHTVAMDRKYFVLGLSLDSFGLSLLLAVAFAS